jgi:hypothetical protein
MPASGLVASELNLNFCEQVLARFQTVDRWMNCQAGVSRLTGLGCDFLQWGFISGGDYVCRRIANQRERGTPNENNLLLKI